MTPEALANLHARAFTHPRPWSAAEFAGLLDSPHVFVTGDAQAFAMGRVIVDEVELLTIATDPTLRRQGLARTVLAQFHMLAAARGAERAFLEVAADNLAARALYQAAGYDQAALRAGYYQRDASPAIDALILTRALP